MRATILGFDIKHYSGSESISDMKAKRNMLKSTLKEAIKDFPKIKEGFENLGTPDTGDGCFIIVDSGKLVDILKMFEKISFLLSAQNSIQLRAVAHRGEVDEDSNLNDSGKTYVGDGVNHCARYLDSKPLKELIEINPSKNFVYSISAEFEKAVSSNEYFDALFYKNYLFRVKTYSNYIYLNISDIENLPEEESIAELTTLSLNKEFKDFLKKADFVYPDKSYPSDLDSFFVYPYLIYQGAIKKSESKIDGKNFIQNYIANPNSALIIGEDQTGKTSLSKKYFEDIFNSKKYIPIYISCTKDGHKLLKNLIVEKFEQQYEQKYSEEYRNSIILIMDNFHYWGNKQQEKIISAIMENPVGGVILFTSSLFKERMDKINMLKDFSFYEIKTFGHEKRNELINKWIDFIDADNENYESVDELNQFVDKTLINGLLPYTPFYILTVLLAKKDFVQNANDKITSKARCYEILVDLQLKYINISDQEIINYRSVFGFIAYNLYKTNREYLSVDELKELILNYKEDYTLSGTPEEIINVFNKSAIFSYDKSFGEYGFSSRYSYYYFVGKYFADKYLEEDGIKNEVNDLLNYLYEKDKYYITIFIVHHLKNEIFFKEVCKKTTELYKEYDEAQLTKEELLYLEEKYTSTEKVILERTDNSAENRIQEAKAKDKYEEENELDEDDPSIVEITKDIQQAIRTVELLGQILKNNGQLRKSTLKEYYSYGMNTFKRICTFFLSNFEKNQDNFIEFIEDFLSKKENGPLSNAQIKTEAHKIFASLNFMSIAATIYRISDALGAKHLVKEVIKPVIDENPTPMNYCIYLHNLMWYMKELPYDQLKKDVKELPDTVQFLIKSLLKEYTDKHHIEMKQKQKLAAALNMNVKALEYDISK